MKTKTENNLEQLIKKCKFDFVNSNINTKNFPPEEIRSTDYKLFHFDRYILSGDVVEEIEKQGYMPANLYELLNWGGWNDKDYVVGLGSSARVGGRRDVPCLDWYDSRRELDLGWWDVGWNPDCRFLAVRELEPSDSMSLERAIEICKENGLEVFKKL